MEKRIILIVKILMSIGVLLIMVGVGLIILTNIKSASSGVLLISSLIAVGMFVVLPAKVYLMFQSLKKKDEHNHSV